MRVLIVLPSQPAATGNRVSAERFRAGLLRLGHQAELVEIAPGMSPTLAARLASFKPDVALLLHAYRTGLPWLALPPKGRPPWAVLLTGTDIHQDFDATKAKEGVREVLAAAGLILSQNVLTVESLRRDHPTLATRIEHLPPGVVLGSAPYRLRQHHRLPTDRPLFLHPAGIRPVKGNLELLHLFDPLATTSPFFVAFCGPVLDRDYGRNFHQAVAARPWAGYLGTIPPAAMAAAMKGADVVVNNSVSEGLSNALAEATALGIPILARDNSGNRAVVRHGRNGLLFRDQNSFSAGVHQILRDSRGPRSPLVPPEPSFDPIEESRSLAELLSALCRGRLPAGPDPTPLPTRR